MARVLLASDSGVVAVDGSGASREAGSPESVAFMAGDGDAAFAVTRQGALWARDSRGRWSLRNEKTVDDEIWSFGVDTRVAGRMYLGVSPALVYRSDDDGLSWTACDSLTRVPGYETWTFPPPPHIPHVRSIIADPGQAGAIYIGVEEGGVFRSPDGGETWQSLNEGLYWDVHTVAAAAGGRDLFATTGAGFHKSADGGGHWEHVSAGIDRRYTVPLLASRAHPGVLYTAAAGGPPPTWAQGVNAALYRSEDGGERWQRQAAGLPERFDVMVGSLLEDGEGNVYAAAGGQVFRCEAGRDRWKLLAEGLDSVRSAVLV